MKILFIATSNISAVGGDTIQLSAEMNMWATNNEVTYFSMYKLYNSNIVSGLKSNIKLIFPTKRNGINEFHLTEEQLLDEVITLDKKENFDYIICRGSRLLEEFKNNYPEIFKSKVISYMTDTKTLTKEQNIEIFKGSYKNKIQSENTIQHIEKDFGIKLNNYLIQPPIIENYFERIKNETSYDIVYTGKIAYGWGVLEYLRFLKNNPKIKGAIVYSRFVENENFIKEAQEIRDLLDSLDNLIIFENLNREETLEVLSKSKVSYCYRSKEIDNDDSFEISTKLLESINLNKIVVLRKTKLHESLLGTDYIWFANSEEEMEEKILESLNYDNEIDIHNRSLEYLSDNIYKKLENQLRI